VCVVLWGRSVSEEGVLVSCTGSVRSPLDLGVIDGELCYKLCVIGWRMCPLHYLICAFVWRGQCVVCSPLDLRELTTGFVAECV
jgi:hypothetical protein